MFDNNLKPNDLKVGDIVATYKSGYGRTYLHDTLRRVRVIKTSNTTITVENLIPGDALKVFQKTSHKERGSDSWHPTYLISLKRYQEIKAAQNVERARREKHAKRERLIKTLTDSIHTEQGFALALQNLNQQEYAPIEA